MTMKNNEDLFKNKSENDLTTDELRLRHQVMLKTIKSLRKKEVMQEEAIKELRDKLDSKDDFIRNLDEKIEELIYQKKHIARRFDKYREKQEKAMEVKQSSSRMLQMNEWFSKENQRLNKEVKRAEREHPKYVKELGQDFFAFLFDRYAEFNFQKNLKDKFDKNKFNEENNQNGDYETIQG